ncbi:grip1-associated protein 1 [Plakobranchus ocellatus]|uniref:Grip1-associated protein 1 n=1 Tax=Plakobranchus ocellatus TaxID=259542 RepID=A0AAV3Y417_9GAST|nr:grip1-associated protein 1 [Plakobranchus ocellatus]
MVDAPSKAVSSSPSYDQLETINQLRLQVDTEKEENRLIKEQLEQLKSETKEQISTLQDELEKAADKLKKKQESYMQLHGEKEKLFKETSTQIKDLQESQERDQKRHAEQMSKLQQQIERSKLEVESQHASSERYTEELQQKLEELQREMNKATVAANQQMNEQAVKYVAEIDALRDKLSKAMRDKEDVDTQLQDARKAANDAVSEMQAAQAKRDEQITAVQEINKVAEKRKSLLDELAIKYQKEYDSHRQNVAKMEEKHREEIQRLQEQLEGQKKTIDQLNRQLPVIEELNKKVASLEESKSWLERRLTETEDELSTAVSSHNNEMAEQLAKQQAEIEELQVTQRSEMDELKQEREKAEEEWRTKEAALQDDLKSLKNKSNHLKQEILDTEDKKKIHEKKGMVMMKDLKRQLHAERRRAEKLQTKLQEVLSEGQGRNMDDLFQSPDSEKNFGENSSVSSWGAGASGVGKDSIASWPQSPLSGNTSQLSDVSVGDEYSDLLRRVGALQQEKWALEEKVNHLETSNACMADDLLNKASIIEHYVMESRSGPKPGHIASPHGTHHHSERDRDEKSGLQKVIDLVNNKTGASSNSINSDMNRKLQAMLEETLTKNMHLQQDLELMSQEVVRLSKLSVSGEVRRVGEGEAGEGGGSDRKNQPGIPEGSQETKLDSSLTYSQNKNTVDISADNLTKQAATLPSSSSYSSSPSSLPTSTADVLSEENNTGPELIEENYVNKDLKEEDKDTSKGNTNTLATTSPTAVMEDNEFRVKTSEIESSDEGSTGFISKGT